MAEHGAWGLMQIRGMGTAYYLKVDGTWIANGGITPTTAIKLWAAREDAEEACTAYAAETNTVQWHVDGTGKPILYGASGKRSRGVG
jgi:hypothetical protein